VSASPGPLVLDVRDLLRHPGSSRAVQASVRLADLDMALAHVPDPVRVEVEVESLLEGLLATGTVSGTMRLDCARCLKPVDQPFRARVRELFLAGATEDDDQYPVVDQTIDLEPMVRDAVILGMPFSPLCRPECLGLCSSCGGDRNLGECRCGPEVDDRWASLSALRLPDGT
jgi:DUF177 domain-containing protein